jgi:hypothetical protein
MFCAMPLSYDKPPLTKTGSGQTSSAKTGSGREREVRKAEEERFGRLRCTGSVTTYRQHAEVMGSLNWAINSIWLGPAWGSISHDGGFLTFLRTSRECVCRDRLGTQMTIRKCH